MDIKELVVGLRRLFKSLLGKIFLFIISSLPILLPLYFLDQYTKNM